MIEVSADTGLSGWMGVEVAGVEAKMFSKKVSIFLFGRRRRRMCTFLG
jgi:hypothetical protein